jgi:transposase
MLSLGGNHRVFLCQHPVDFRKAHDGLCAVIRNQFGDDPFSSDVFAFFNRAKDRIKLLVWDRNGFWLLYKRLEKGTFPFAVSGEGRLEIEQGQLAMILEGIEWKKAKRVSRFSSTVAITKRDDTRARSSA